MEKATELGAVKTLNYKENDFGQEWSAEKIDVILDCVGGDYWRKNMKVGWKINFFYDRLGPRNGWGNRAVRSYGRSKRRWTATRYDFRYVSHSQNMVYKSMIVLNLLSYYSRN